MHVVRHQNVGVDHETETLSILFDTLKIGLPVLVITENHPALIASRNDMIKSPFKLNS